MTMHFSPKLKNTSTRNKWSRKGKQALRGMVAGRIQQIAELELQK
jgi:hypothetical protein